MTTDPRALIAEGRKHDEAMTPAPWYGRSRFVSRVPDNTGMGATLHANHIANTADREDAAGIAWLRTNLAALLDGYASALDEVERLKALETVSPEDITAVVEQNSALAADNARLLEAFDQAIRSLSTDGTVRNAFCSWCNQRWPMLDGESHEVARKYANDHAQQCAAHPLRIERDALRVDLEASRAICRHFEQERDSWPAAYQQRAAPADERIAELQSALTAALDGWQYQHNKRCEAEMRDMDDMDDRVIKRIDGYRKLLSSIGEPCTDAMTTK